MILVQRVSANGMKRKDTREAKIKSFISQIREDEYNL